MASSLARNGVPLWRMFIASPVNRARFWVARPELAKGVARGRLRNTPVEDSGRATQKRARLTGDAIAAAAKQESGNLATVWQSEAGFSLTDWPLPFRMPCMTLRLRVEG